MLNKDLKSIQIIIPFYNEERNLKILLPKIFLAIKNVKNKVNLILVDDLSTDNSFNCCKRLSKKRKDIKLLKLTKKGKQSGAIKMALKKSQAEFVITMDSDLQDDPKYLINFINKINEGYDLVIGNRIVRKAPLLLRFAIKIFDIMCEIYLGKKLKTYRSPYAAFRSKYIKSLRWHNNDHRYLIPIAISRGAKKCITIDYILRQRRFGDTNYNARLKVIMGFFEFTFFLFRLIFGKYK